MKIKALESFSGAISMHKGEIKDISDKNTLDDLLKCGYIKKLNALEEKDDKND